MRSRKVRDLQYKGNGLSESEEGETTNLPPVTELQGGPKKEAEAAADRVSGMFARLKGKFKRNKREEAPVEEVKNPAATLPPVQPQPPKPVQDITPSRPGGIRKVKHPTWNPDQTRRGGRVVKRMPRDLRTMKEKQEGSSDGDE